MNTHKEFITIMLIIVFTILIFTVSNKERNDIVESFKFKKKRRLNIKNINNIKKIINKKFPPFKTTRPVLEEIQQSIKQVLEQVVQEVVERAEQQGVGGTRLQEIQTAANNVVSGSLGCINEKDTAILNDQIDIMEIVEGAEGEIDDLKLQQQHKLQLLQQQFVKKINNLEKKNATLLEKLEKARGTAASVKT